MSTAYLVFYLAKSTCISSIEECILGGVSDTLKTNFFTRSEMLRPFIII